MNLPQLSIRNQALVWLLVVATCAWGFYHFLHISRREDPEIKISMALIITIWPGAGAEKVERLITKKIEDRIEQINTVEKITSTSRENLSVVFVEMDFSCDIDMAWQKLRNKVAEVRPELPAGIIGPDIMDDFGDVTAMIYSLSSKTAEPSLLKQYAEQLKAELRQVEAVGKIELIGVQTEAIYIEGPLDSFTLYGFQPLVAAKILDYQNVNIPSGYVRDEVRNYRLDPTGSFERVEQLREAVLDVSKESGAPLRVGDVFSVRRAYQEPPFDRMRSHGQPAVGLDIRMKDGFNIVAMGEAVRKQATEFAKRLPKDIQLSLVHNQPHAVERFIDDFMVNLLEGLAIVVAVLFLWMGWRMAAIIALQLPLSILFTFAVMPSFSVDLETVSIATFIIALGMLVDNAIIVADNIYRHMELGADRFTAAWQGTQQLFVPVITGTLGSVFAFLPLLLMSDETGAYIRSLPIVVSGSLLASLLLAVTLVPVMCHFGLRPDAIVASKKKGKGRFRRFYRAMLRGGIRVRYLVILLSLAALGGAVALVPVVGLSFFPEADRDQLTIDVWLPEGSSLTATEKVAAQVEKIVAQQPEVVGHISYVGKGGPRFYITVMPEFNTTNYAQVVVTTNDPTVTRSLAKRLNEQFRRQIIGARVMANPLLLGIPVEAPIVVRITGPDLVTMKQISQQVQDRLRQIPGTTRVRDNLGEEVISLRVVIDAQAATMFGLSNTEIAAAMLTAYDGLPVTRLREGEDEIQVYFRLVESQRDFDNALHQLTVPSQATGGKVPLSAFAHIEPSWSPGVIKRYNNRRSVSVLADLDGRLADEVMQDLHPQLEALRMPPGYQLDSAGEEAERIKSFGELSVVFAIILLALLILLVMQFRSFKRALIILGAVPLAIIGAILGLLFSHNTFGFMAFLGVVSLAGMVIKNAVVWVEFVESAVQQGEDLQEAIIEAGLVRLRPIMLTAATTVAGLIPLALFGGALWEGMSYALIVGLSLATVLTLVVIPIVYYTFVRLDVSRKRQGRTVPPPSDPPPRPAAVTVSAVVALLGLLVALTAGPTPVQAQTHPLAAYLAAAEREAAPLRMAELDVDGAEADQLQATLSFLPQVQAEATVTRLDRSQSLSIDTSTLGLPLTLPEIVLVDQNVYRTAIRITVPLYVGGQRFAYLAAAKHAVAARKQAVRAVILGVRFGAAAYYVQLLEAQHRVTVRRESLDIDQRMTAIARQKVAAQMATPFDISFAETIAADGERQWLETQSETHQRQLDFNHLLGRPLGAPVELQDLRFDPQFQADPIVMLPDLRRRPELAALSDACGAADEQATAVFGVLLPTLALVGEGGYKEGDFGYTDGKGYGMATVALQWNLMADGAAWARLSKARVESRQARQRLDEQRRRLEFELAQAVRQHEDIRRLFAVATRAVKTAWQGFDNAQQAYRTGVLGIQPLTEAAKALAGAKENYLKAYYGQLLAELQVRYRAGQPVINAVNYEGGDPLTQLQVLLDAASTGNRLPKNPSPEEERP